MPEKRPVNVTIITAVVFLIGVWNIWRVFALVQSTPQLQNLSIRPDPRIRLLFALGWAILFLLLAVGLHFRFRQTRRAIPFGLALYAVYNLLLLALFVQSAYVRQTWLLQFVGYVLIVVYTGWVLSRPGLNSYWKT